MIQIAERQHTLACMEVWGTNRSVIRTVELAELTAWVYSKPAGGEDGGDGQFLFEHLSEFRQDNFTDDETIIAIQRGNPL